MSSELNWAHSFPLQVLSFNFGASKRTWNPPTSFVGAAVQVAPRKQKWTACWQLAEILHYPLSAPNKNRAHKVLCSCFGAGKRTWTSTELPRLEPESSASANSAMPAYGVAPNTRCNVGARNGTWTRTVWTTRPSNVRVCQFRHSRKSRLIGATGILYTFFWKSQELFQKKQIIFQTIG